MTTTVAPSDAPFLSPVERPRSLFMRIAYYLMRRKFGKVMTPASVFSARMPTAFTLYYGKIGRLDRKLEINGDLVALLRARVARVNGCAFCLDATTAAAIERSEANRQRFNQLNEYGTSGVFTARERAALDYATDLSRDHRVSAQTFSELKRHFSEREICDVVWVVASEHLYNISNIGLNIGSDGFCDVTLAA